MKSKNKDRLKKTGFLKKTNGERKNNIKSISKEFKEKPKNKSAKKMKESPSKIELISLDNNNRKKINRPFKMLWTETMQ